MSDLQRGATPVELNASDWPVAEQQTPLTPELIAELAAVPLLASLRPEQLHCLEPVHVVQLEAGTVLAKAGEVAQAFWILLEGEVEIVELQADGREFTTHVHTSGAAFGEVPLLANIPNSSTVRARGKARLLRLDESGFWRLMTACPEVRQAILRNMAMRLQKMQRYTVQQEKMAALGTLAAGLMHELNNPGAAARRAASQLRENFLRLHELSNRFNHQELAFPQRNCLATLEQRALHSDRSLALSSIEQSDAEEALADWLDMAQVPDAWRLAPTLVSIGLGPDDMECARHEFADGTFNDVIAWLEAIVSSVQLVSTIEESIGRVTELVKSVKSYAYEGSGQVHAVNLNESIHAALVILGHKIREKQITLRKELGAALPQLHCACKGLNQVWTNLLDNAIDAVAPGGQISIKTWAEVHDGKSDLCILIGDDGEGIRPEVQAHIFDPFFTTKEPGVGTGLGLGIVSRLVEQNMGVIRFTSQPGQTEFVVRLPAEPGSRPASS